jgi:8-oxo-dGTP diphosphatase
MNNSYKSPIVTVDSVIFQLVDNELKVLLIQRANEPFKDQWALPGGYNSAGETTREALSRVLREKAGVKINELQFIEQLYTFDTVARDPRGHAISVTYMGLGKNIKLFLSKTSQNPNFFNVNKLPKLAYDHDEIIRYAHERLGFKVTYTNAVSALLQDLFTMSQLQIAYEAILKRSLDKRNFRKKILSLDLIVSSDKYYQDGAHRPAQLYKFKQQDLQVLSRSFD